MLKVLRNPHFFIMLMVDLCLISVSFFLAYYLRYDGNIPLRELELLVWTLLWVVPLKLVLFFSFGMYKGMWRYTGIQDLKNLTKACFAGTALVVVILMLTVRFEGFPRSIFPIDLALTFLLTGGARVGIRLYFHREENDWRGFLSFGKKRAEGKRILIAGAGDAGRKDPAGRSWTIRVFPILLWVLSDDDPGKRGRALHHASVLGQIKDIPGIVKKRAVEEVVIAIPSATGDQMRNIVHVCEVSGVSFKTLPGIGELIDGRVSVKALRDVNYADLLGRASVKLNEEAIGEYLRNKCVLVTGAGGSIGSELCRQIIKFEPGILLLWDASEPGLYSIQMELKHRVGYLKYRTILGRVQDKQLMDSVFRAYKPEVVFHAAAYKHVPMLERNPWEAIYNNILGSRCVIEKVVEHRVERMVLVSTDKAVRPTNVMGASKRMAEMVLQAWQGKRDPVDGGSLWECGGILGVGDSAFPGADRAGWPGDRYPSGGDPGIL